MTIDDIIKCIDDTIQSFRLDVDNKFKIASDLNALRTLRLQQRGIDSEGNRFKPYAAATKRIRAKKGLQTSYVDHTDTGLMFQSIKPIIINNDRQTGLVVFDIAPTDRQRAMVAEYLDNYRPGMWLFSADEIDKADQANQLRVNRALEKCLLSA